MRIAILFVIGLVACSRGTPSATLIAGTRSIESTAGVVDAVAGTPIQVVTDWSELCGGHDGAEALGVKARPPERCNEVRHRVHLHCVQRCEIRAPDGTRTTNEVTFGPTTMRAAFVVTTDADVLALSLVIDAGRDQHELPLPIVRFVAPTDIVVECGKGFAFGPCTNVPADPTIRIRVRELHHLSLPEVRVNGTSIASGKASLTKVLNGNVRTGNFPLTVEVRAGKHVIRRQVVLNVR